MRNPYNISDHFSEEEKDRLILYYRKRRQLIILIVFFIFALCTVCGTLGYFYMNDLYYFEDEMKLELENSKTVVIKLSEIDEFDPLDYVSSYSRNDTVLKIPDMSDIKNIPGKYRLEYCLVSKKEKKTVKKYLDVRVSDDIKPELVLSSKNETVTVNSSVDLRQYIVSATDNIDGDLITEVKFDTLDTSVTGTQNIKYTVKDSSGNYASSEIVFTVNDVQQTAPAADNTPSSADTAVHSENKKTSESSTADSDRNTNRDSETSKNSVNGKTFLFTDGYDMSNVMSACASTLSQANVSGTCQPLYDSNGIIIGAKIVVD